MSTGRGRFLINYVSFLWFSLSRSARVARPGVRDCRFVVACRRGCRCGGCPAAAGCFRLSPQLRHSGSQTVSLPDCRFDVHRRAAPPNRGSAGETPISVRSMRTTLSCDVRFDFESAYVTELEISRTTTRSLIRSARHRGAVLPETHCAGVACGRCCRCVLRVEAGAAVLRFSLHDDAIHLDRARVEAVTVLGSQRRAR